ncbi:MAG: hypothetical protein COW11_06535 [Candidatus Omnitrophica bacterium CG12_big_fil_rev_8_21_14_0_65_43_15]|uniref:DUF4382 domain-containing protein n=1 Tax=Candidatus Taenaricola geysiri TaxID=1974752 RepID=A0A2J0LJQ8_9BACT|nr:DUF4382 domain-containing protein [Cyanobacteria bacterium CG_2015-16_32_12]PIW65823.1 MAG: hypothetical protein COW11_06535 [Candidatus Omnitrophica bacterium CG12_big_fil_rev_8_21_14_0_65_43_15]
MIFSDMKKLFIIIIFLGMAGFVYANPGDSNNFYGNADGTYIVTISKIEISQDNSTWITLGEGAQQFNIASLTAGTDFSNYVSNTSITAGAYKYVRVTVSRAIQIKGSGTNSGHVYYTTAATVSVDGGSLGVASAADDNTNYAIATIVIPSSASSPDPNEALEVSGDNLIVTRTLDELFTVTSGGGSLQITFTTQTSIEFDPDDSPGNVIFWPIPPSMSFDFV